MHREDQRRKRRRKIVYSAVAGLIVAGVLAGGIWAVTTADDGAPTSKAPIAGVQTFGKLGRTHVQTPVAYPQTPPVGGDHSPVWLDCNGAVYTRPVPDENAVHSLEHGAVWITYNDQASPADVAALAAKVQGKPYTFMSPYPAEQGKITLTAWGNQLVVDSPTDPRVDAFLAQYVQGPQTPEPGAPCTDGLMP
ncbi:DUF3105 domain-containing protein [Kitasatospora sp. A2-31]|uniref:DUF3105 domain-containing protein n=1 Tax=Kitasatospora sp. A2-31 TaxID=2916414 RepID=UPI001EEAE1A0|nr:DUF3105 domain-containing protein [Kitasatospora sp. A2-31]MCG6493967.1 DUF3105 domain-containing protein [Kitasatospora sp. A2-31]MCG6500464.1 DUF3105 domain-containing protein [Kitasatospora sp. A2-31]